MSVDVAYTEDGPGDAQVVVLSRSLRSTPAMWNAQGPALAELLTVSPAAHLGDVWEALRVTGALLGQFDAVGATR